MPLVVWDDAYCIGVAEFDAEHRDLMEIINTLADQIAAGAPAAVLATTCDGLIAHTVTHFDHEESRFAGYPRAEEHRQMHDRLKTQAGAFRQAVGNGNAQEGLRFISDLIAHHITGEDKVFGAWLAPAGLR